MRWSILTPEGSLHWDTQALTFGPALAKSEAPRGDDLEDWWRSYYRSTFNPARANPTAQRAEMPKKYWRNLPEATLIPELLATSAPPHRADDRSRATRAAQRAWTGRPTPSIAPDGRHARRAQGAGQRHANVVRCGSPRRRTVFGEGPADAPVVFVGEQPGDQEDLAGRPFVGPAGQMFDRALAEAGIERSRVYVTNAVKHFKYEPRGKRRIHKTPNNAEIDHCRWWVESELALIKPQLTVALGATAAAP